MKCLLILLVPLPIALWAAVGVIGSVVMGIWYGFVWPITETFNAVSKEAVSVRVKIFQCVTVHLKCIKFLV